MKNDRASLPADVREQSETLAAWLDCRARNGMAASFTHEIEQALMTQRSRGLQEGLGMALQVMSESGGEAASASAIRRLIRKLQSA
jgi:hypothetical protein